ncbi:type II toxin-antitoxin system RelE/ParE family toxin [Symbiopectobacterium purcellii]|uniref:Type II toxin-antitoxin system RelE/ParE family toxin n=1 Tax=Symbiopectobacterium purcellii TaxID=2871826 RepID=A0ABX9ANE8_9ENTR|nr:type II toxin-antitoxin system RelE/ParE family toxin [Symbiopectobacterium purcellii]QZN96709.1 type II toxin-antitoxin system RelE/ParE family toxin [Symbiopectobacterium purcellii]
MIKTWKHKGLQQLYLTGNPKGVLSDKKDVERIRQRLYVIDSAETLDEIAAFANYKLHPLTGNRKGTYSITVRANWRITFEFEDGDAYILDLEDYH